MLSRTTWRTDEGCVAQEWREGKQAWLKGWTQNDAAAGNTYTAHVDLLMATWGKMPPA